MKTIDDMSQEEIELLLGGLHAGLLAAIRDQGIKAPPITLVLHETPEKPHVISVGRSRKAAVEALTKVVATIQGNDPARN